jgi:hypothetical protein
MGDLRRMRVTVYISTVFQYLDKSYSNIYAFALILTREV